MKKIIYSIKKWWFREKIIQHLNAIEVYRSEAEINIEYHNSKYLYYLARINKLTNK